MLVARIASPATAGMAALGAALLLSSAGVLPAAAATATGHVTVIILPSAAVIESAPIRLAIAKATVTPGRVTLRPITAADAGVLTLVGAPNTAITLSFGPVEALGRPTAAVSVGAFAHNAGPSPSLNSAGVLNVAVGATLTLPSLLLAPGYSGTYALVVNY